MNSLRGPGWSPAGDVSAGLFHQYNGSWRLPPPGHLSQVRGSTARYLNLKLSVFYRFSHSVAAQTNRSLLEGLGDFPT